MAVTHASVTQGDESAEGTSASALIEHLHLALKCQLLEQNGLSRLQKAAQLQKCHTLVHFPMQAVVRVVRQRCLYRVSLAERR